MIRKIFITILTILLVSCGTFTTRTFVITMDGGKTVVVGGVHSYYLDYFRKVDLYDEWGNPVASYINVVKIEEVKE